MSMGTTTPAGANAVRALFTKEKIFQTTVGNALGLQVFRILLSRSLLLLRRRQCPERDLPEVRQLAREGYCVIENFLPPAQFEAIRDEFNKARAASEFQVGPVDRENVVTDLVHLDWKERSRFAAAVGAFRDNPRFTAILRGHEGRSEEKLESLGDFKGMFWSSYCVSDADDREKLELTNCDLHADTFHTITKAFLYLNDVDGHNGSHVYVPRSHRMSVHRLLFEYLNSIGRKYGAPRVSEEKVKRMGMTPVSMDYPANTLIIANEQGFHARGRFDPDRQRDLVYIEYRSHPFRNR